MMVSASVMGAGESGDGDGGDEDDEGDGDGGATGPGEACGRSAAEAMGAPGVDEWLGAVLSVDGRSCAAMPVPGADCGVERWWSAMGGASPGMGCGRSAVGAAG